MHKEATGTFNLAPCIVEEKKDLVVLMIEIILIKQGPTSQLMIW